MNPSLVVLQRQLSEAPERRQVQMLQLVPGHLEHLQLGEHSITRGVERQDHVVAQVQLLQCVPTLRQTRDVEGAQLVALQGQIFQSLQVIEEAPGLVFSGVVRLSGNNCLLLK